MCRWGFRRETGKLSSCKRKTGKHPVRDMEETCQLELKYSQVGNVGGNVGTKRGWETWVGNVGGKRG